MQVEDLREQAREVQLLRVTKDLQLNLSEESRGNRDQHEIETLEKTLEINESVTNSCPQNTHTHMRAQPILS